LIFAGPEGAGKELMAVRLAALLECDAGAGRTEPGLFEGSAAAPGVCGPGRRCNACMKVRTLEHPDIHLLYPVPHDEMEEALPKILESRREDFFSSLELGNRARSIGIDVVRHVAEVLSKHPFEGRRIVIAILEAHLATAEAQNALLKLLEEPPPTAAIILVTEFPERLLPTILSRCREIRFDPLATDAIAAFLAEFYAVERREAARIAPLARGNLRRAIKFLDPRFVTLWKDAAGVVRLVLEGKTKELIAEAEELSGFAWGAKRSGYAREEVRELLEETAILFALMIRSREGAADEAEAASLAESIGAGALAKAAGRDLAGDMRKVFVSIESLRRNADVELTLSQLFLDLAGAWY
jgi:DNA polymerase-3 subunit delta'